MTLSVPDICEAIDPPVRLIPPHVTRTPGATRCGRVLERIVEKRGDQHTILLLRTIMESENNRMALVEPVLWAVSDVIAANQTWVDRGLEWFDAFDEIDLCQIWDRAKDANGAPRERHGVAAKLTELLREKFGEAKEETLL